MTTSGMNIITIFADGRAILPDGAEIALVSSTSMTIELPRDSVLMIDGHAHRPKLDPAPATDLEKHD